MSNMADRTPRPVGVHYHGDLRAALLDAAALAVAEAGPDQLSLRAVARRLGVSHAAPAHHFGDRTGLLTALAVQGFERFLTHLIEALAAAPDDAPVTLLQALGRAYAAFAQDNAGYFDVMFQPSLIRLDDPAYAAASDAAFAALRDLIGACQAAGWHPDDDPLALAAATWSLAHGLSVLRRQGSLARHYPDPSLDGLAAIAATLLGAPADRA